MKYILAVLGLSVLALDCAPTKQTQESLLSPCAVELIGGDALCGDIAVPINHENSKSGTLLLPVVVAPALSSSGSGDPLFVLVGGPGQSAVDLAGPLSTIFSRVRKYRDLVFVDQRGTGKRSDLPCTNDSKDESIIDFSDTTADIERIKSCRKSWSVDPSYFTTDDTARDLDLVRQRLGYRFINVWGASYGTRLALHYAYRYPENTRSLVLDGVAAGNAIYEALLADTSRGVIRERLKRCDNTAECSKQFSSIGSRFESYLQTLPKGNPSDIDETFIGPPAPYRVNTIHPTTGNPIEISVDQQITWSLLGALLFQRDTAELLPSVVDQLIKGNWAPLLSIALPMASKLESGISMGLQLSVFCSEDYQLQKLVPPKKELSRSVIAMSSICEDWPTRQIPHLAIQAETMLPIPTLLLSGELDPVTPPQRAEMVKTKLTNAKHLVFHAEGHGVSAKGCAPKLIDSFIRTGKLPSDEESSCATKPTIERVVYPLAVSDP